MVIIATISVISNYVDEKIPVLCSVIIKLRKSGPIYGSSARLLLYNNCCKAFWLTGPVLSDNINGY